MDISVEAAGAGLCAAGMLGAWIFLKGKASPPYEKFNIPVGKVSKLYVYPIKSCHRIEVKSVECWKRGLKYDRSLVCVYVSSFLAEKYRHLLHGRYFEKNRECCMHRYVYW